MISKNNYKLLIYSFLYISLLFGLFINEDLTIGYKADHYTHLIVIEFFNQMFLMVNLGLKWSVILVPIFSAGVNHDTLLI